jgi:hypothetical protein
VLLGLKRAYLQKRLGTPIIVVSGLPRSGTSMMMKMLEAGGIPVYADGIRQPDEDNPLGYYEFEEVKSLLKNEDKAWVAGGRGKAVKIVSTLLPGLPDSHFYKVIFMHRHLDEVIPSQNKMLMRRGEPVDEAGNERTRGILERHLRKTKLWLADQPNFAVADVQYKGVIADPRGQALRIRSYLRADLDIEQMVAAVNPELYRNRRVAMSATRGPA